MKNMLSKARNMEEAMAVFKPGPLDMEELALFYVNTDKSRNKMHNMINRFKQQLDFDYSAKILFAGHRGSGKSTELNRLKSKIQDKYFIIQFSVLKELDIHNIEYSDLILLLVEKIFQQSSENGLIKNQKIIETVYKWFAKISVKDTEETKYDMELTAEAEASTGIFSPFLNLMAKLRSQIKFGSNRKTTIRKEIQQRISQLRTNCNVIIREARKNLGDKKMLVIVEDLDKIELKNLKEMFYEHSGILSEIETQIIYTIPIFLLNSPLRNVIRTKFCDITLPMVKIYNLNNGKKEEFKEGRGILKEIVNRRLEPESGILKEEDLNLVIDKTGGVIRDIFRVLDTAVSSALSNNETGIGEDYIKYGLNQLKHFYYTMLSGDPETGITTDQIYDKLKQIRDEKLYKPKYDETIGFLLNCQALIEYNGDGWMDIHPLVLDLMKEMKI